MKIVDDYPVVKISTAAARGVSGGLTGVIAVGVVSLFHGLSVAQEGACIIAVTAVLGSVRHFLKIRFSRFFSWL